ncbi:adenylate isopentenyltransferase 5, chloroplastic-like [Neltuma alba]|uniref:adenylate isopentenyltransferase 5, chloroplastic-like n=1 Tax=Neltuma alba TaxID=207710 RepID=UPI0010A35A3F|nr:adenylate isopentenyltransferase 5, chloroplastic-like [Prosopis alba]
MNIVSLSVCQQVPPLVNFQTALAMEPFFRHPPKDKAVVILGATGTGKSRLAIDLATSFPPAEIVNSDKMQVYRGLDITTNKVTEEECRGVQHHLLGIADPNSNFTAVDFTRHASSAIDSIVRRDRLPIIAGGSNSYIEALIEDDAAFRLKYECFFLWVDVSLPVLDSFLSKRVDRMIKAGQVDEVRQFFDPAGDYTTGIRRAIGVPEFDEFLRTEATADEGTKKRLLEAAIAKIKANNCSLARRQIQKIHRLYNMWKRNAYRLDATEVFTKSGDDAEELWETHVLAKSQRIVRKFLHNDGPMVPPASAMSSVPLYPQAKQVAMATASH